jgi:hypothetical protein
MAPMELLQCETCSAAYCTLSPVMIFETVDIIDSLKSLEGFESRDSPLNVPATPADEAVTLPWGLGRREGEHYLRRESSSPITQATVQG